MTQPTVAILEPGYREYDIEAQVLKVHNARIVPVEKDTDAVPALKALDPVAIMMRERIVGAAEMDACPNLKVVVRYGVGVDNADLDHARARGVFVANVPDYGAGIEVSEHAVALYLGVQHRLLTRDAEVRRGEWGIGQAARIPGRAGAVLGLVGGGRIGRAAAKKFRALGFGPVLVFDPFLTPDLADAEGLDLVDIDTLCREADVVSLHAPLTEETSHILNAERIALMKPTSIVVNVSRGGLVDEAALARALTEGRLFGAGVDVFEQEPVSGDNPLLKAPNTIVSDHTAWYSERSVSVLQELAALEVRRVLDGDKPANWVNPW